MDRVAINASMSKMQPLDVSGLTRSQLAWLASIARQFRLPHTFSRRPESDLVTDVVLENIGDLLRIHHSMSRKSLSKAPFEYAFEKALHLSNLPAKLADSSTNPGYDLAVGNVRISLKTEAAKNIKAHSIHVSKWMEMGKGTWDPENIQRQRFLAHLQGYDRILTLRCLLQAGNQYRYELVEIPKALMLESANGRMEKAAKTRQETSPWYCRVMDQSGNEKYHLYFDAGTERKLQVRNLQKELCVVHATWSFDSEPLTAAPSDGEDDSATSE